MPVTVEVEPSNALTVYGRIDPDVLALLTEAFRGVGGFSAYKVLGRDSAGGDEPQTYSAAAFNKVKTAHGACMTYDCRLRPARTLLRLLGRVQRDVPADEVVEGLPDVTLAQPLASLRGDTVLRISAESINETARTEQGTPTDAGSVLDALPVFGPGVFSLSVAEAVALEESGRVVCDGAVLPPRFYRSLVRHTSHHLAYYSDRRTLPLLRIGSGDTTTELRKLQEEAIARATELRAAMCANSRDVKTCFGSSPEDVAAFEEYACAHERQSSKLARATVARAQMQWADPKDAEHRVFIANILADPQACGFEDEAAARRTLSLSLNELSSSVCQAQQGYFLVGEGNQLAEKTTVPITFLSAAGIDFCTDISTVVEGRKYFVENEDWTPTSSVKHKFSGWLPGGQELFYDRVRRLYRCIFRAAQEKGVKYPCVLPMGLGVFLDNVPECCRDALKRAYFKAQADLLSEQDWGFSAYVMNAGAPAMVGFFRGLLESSSVDLDALTCPIVLHTRDVKFAAVALAQRAQPAAYLNPSDAIAVMQGLVGYFWELGKGTCYVGEEDFSATSTSLLSRAGLSDVHTDPARVLAA